MALKPHEMFYGGKDVTRCQICGETLPEESKKLQPHGAFTSIPGLDVYWTLCSPECAKKWAWMHITFNTLKKLKKLSGMAFWEFQELFNFPTEGGYAEEKFKKLRIDTLAFVLGLDTHNQMRISTIKL